MRTIPSNRLRTVTGALLLVFPLAIQIPYAMLTATFDYPHILREPADVILRRYAAAGPAIPLAWYLFGLSVLPLLAAIAMLPAAIRPANPRWLQAATPLGIASAMLQMLGLLRWVVLVPLLADAYTAPTATPELRATIAIVFRAQHQLFGVLIGEHLGQILLALWTAGVAVSLGGRGTLQKVLRWAGFLAAALFLVGSGESLGTVFPAVTVLAPLPVVAFLIWSVWCALLGFSTLRSLR